jgi:hypothetical protein
MFPLDAMLWPPRWEMGLALRMLLPMVMVMPMMTVLVVVWVGNGRGD